MTFALDIFAPTPPAPTGGSARDGGQDNARPADDVFASKVADAVSDKEAEPARAAAIRGHAAKGHLIAPDASAEADAETATPAAIEPAVIAGPEVGTMLETPVPAMEVVEADTAVAVEAPVVAAPPVAPVPSTAPAVPAPIAPAPIVAAEVTDADIATSAPQPVAPDTLPTDVPDADAAPTAQAPMTDKAAVPPAPETPTPVVKPSTDAASAKAVETPAPITDRPATEQTPTDRAAAETVKAATPPAAPAPTPAVVTAQAAAPRAPVQPAAKPDLQAMAEAAPTDDAEPKSGEAKVAPAAPAAETPRPIVGVPLVATTPPAHIANRMLTSNAAAAGDAGDAPLAPDASVAKAQADSAAADIPAPAPSAPTAKPDTAAVVSAPAPAATPEVAGETPRAAMTSPVEAQRTAVFSQLSHATIETTAQIAAQIARRLEGRSTRFDMVLTPEDLGRVDVQLEIDSDGRLAARLAFDNPAAATDLRGRADELRRQLQDAGFQLADNALDFTQRDTSSGGGFDRRQDRNALFAGGSRLAAQADAAAVPAAWINLALTPDRVDMKV